MQSHYQVTGMFKMEIRHFSLANDDMSTVVPPRTLQKFQRLRTNFLQDARLHGSPPCMNTRNESLLHSNTPARTSDVPDTTESRIPHDSVSTRAE